MSRPLALTGRFLLALLFVLGGVAKILTPQPYLDHMAQVGVPTELLPAVLALEIGAGMAVLFGWRLTYAAAALGGFCVLTAVIFHHDLADKVERTQFFKDLAIAGGLLAMVAASRRERAA